VDTFNPSGYRVREVGDDLVGLDDADVHIGHQRECATPLAGTVVEDDCAGRRDADGACGDHRIELVNVNPSASRAPSASASPATIASR
jgi:hypothetical protein